MTPHRADILHWFWFAFFLLFGIYMLTRTKMGSACAAPYRTDDPSSEARIDAAVVRRQQAEGTPPPLWLWTGVPCICLAVVQAFWPAQPGLLYALMCLSIAVATGIAYTRLKNSQPKRVAVLANRSVESVIPSYWFAIAAISSVSMLAFVSDKNDAVPAIVVCVASMVTAFVARRLTLLPALLSGVDVPAEQLVDDKLRFARSSVPLTYTFCSTFAFCVQAMPIDNPSSVQTTAYLWNWFPWLFFGIWMVWRLRKPHDISPA